MTAKFSVAPTHATAVPTVTVAVAMRWWLQKSWEWLRQKGQRTQARETGRFLRSLR